MAKRNQDSPHWSLADVTEYLDSFSPPTGNFNPEGQWAHKYIIWINTKGSRPPAKEDGYVTMHRKPASQDGKFKLQVEQYLVFSRWRSQLTKAEIQCQADPLATPKSWTLESVGKNTKDKTIQHPKFEESATVANGRITRTGKRTRQLEISNPFTLDWALFDAVQRLKGERSKAIEFDMFEDFDLLRPKQRLSYHGTIDVKLNGKLARLIGYHQIGEGILPTHYWLDEQYRLLFVTGGCRVYLFDSEIK